MSYENDRASLVLWRSPLKTSYYFLNQLWIELFKLVVFFFSRTLFVATLVFFLVFSYAAVCVDGPHQVYISTIRNEATWCLYWVGLGVLSSVGFGTGLHTFLLYLGPHIASVTIAAWECKSTDFPSPPYPDKITCPAGDFTPMIINIFAIMAKVRVESFMWGAGTAIGELPPYFMARTARLSGQKLDDEDFNEIENIKKMNDLDIWSKSKLFVHDLVQKAGFFGILAAASIPNPLFDLAGVVCGHFLVPFITFFGAALIGKAVIKMHLQMFFIIFIFTKSHLEALENFVASLPVVGSLLHAPFVEYMEKQKLKLHSGGKIGGGNGESIISKLYEILIVVMVGYFIISIINSMAQQYHKENKEDKKQK